MFHGLSNNTDVRNIIPFSQRCDLYFINLHRVDKRDVYGSVHHDTNLIEMTNKIQLCRTIYYSIVP